MIMRKLLFFVILALALTGCAKEGAQRSYGERFSARLYGYDLGATIYVITDKQTGQEYLFVKSGYGGGLAPMQTQSNPKH